MFAQPTRLDEALDLAAKYRPRVLAGGTDLMVGATSDLGPEPILDISRIAEIKGLRTTDDEIVIGGGVTWSELVAAELPNGFAGLKAAALEVGSVQIQNRGTIAGNLCNASPAADGVPPLLTLDAVLELRSVSGARRLPLSEFITGNRRTRLEAGELVATIHVPRRLAEGRSAFLKLGSRRFLVISVVAVAVLLVPDDQGRVAEVRIAVGACSPVAMRLLALEQALMGQTMTASLSEIVESHHVEALRPIDDVRASAAYRKDAALQVIREALRLCVDGRGGGMA